MPRSGSPSRGRRWVAWVVAADLYELVTQPAHKIDPLVPTVGAGLAGRWLDALVNRALGDGNERVIRPGSEPVYGAAVHQRRKEPETVPEGLPDGRKRQGDVEVRTHAREEECVELV